MIDSRDLKAMIDPALSAEPIDMSEANEPIEPKDRTDPTEPIDSTEPFDAIDRNESCDQRDNREPCDVIAPACRNQHPEGVPACLRVAATCEPTGSGSFGPGPRLRGRVCGGGHDW
jgi:hypothetical protein